jgi:hypothetical protein
MEQLHQLALKLHAFLHLKRLQVCVLDSQMARRRLEGMFSSYTTNVIQHSENSAIQLLTLF